MFRVLLCLVSILIGVSLLSCDQLGQSSSSTIEPPSAPYRPITSVRETMLWILDPAVDVIWDSAGTIITAEGRTELAPTTDEGWEHVRNNAALLAECGNLLMIPGRSVGKDWDDYSKRLIDAGQLAMKAAEAQDSDALFDAGGELYQVCRACHEQYMIPIAEARQKAGME